MPIPHQTMLAVLRTVRDEELAAHERQRSRMSLRSADAVRQAVAREQEIQQALQDAIAVGDREPAMPLLRAIFDRLGMAFDGADDDTNVLGHYLLRAMVDISKERERRETGDYRSESMLQTIDAHDCRNGPETRLDHGPMAFVSQRGRNVLEGAFGALADSTPVCATPPLCASISASAQNLTSPPHAIAPPPPPPTWPAPAPADLRIDVSVLSSETRSALQNPAQMRLSQAFQFYRELKLAGYPDQFQKTQKRTAQIGRSWKHTSEPSFKVAQKIWTDFLGDIALGDVTDTMVTDGLEKLARVPKAHGKTFKLKTTYTAMIEHVDALEIQNEAAAARTIERNPDLTEAEREELLLNVRIERLRSETFLKHGRILGRIGRCLEALHLLSKNPFALCSWTNEEERKLKEAEEARTRVEWDDRLYDLFRTPVFQGEADEPGDPLFWAPLISVHQGLRMQETIQLAPDDFGFEGGHPYLRVRNTDGNHVKSLSGERRMPVHPNLIRLGLMHLVDLRRRENMPRLFPHLGRGETKGTHSELFTKAFGYYRKKHDVYWPGLDFHALRTTFHGFLLNSRTVSDARRRRLMGHTPVDEGEKSYAQGLRASTLLDDIREVDIDISMIQSPFRAGEQKIVSLKADRIQRMAKRA